MAAPTRTACVNGHPRIPANVYRYGGCKVCQRERSVRRRLEIKLEILHRPRAVKCAEPLDPDVATYRAEKARRHAKFAAILEHARELLNRGAA